MVVWSALRNTITKNNSVILQNVVRRSMAGDHRILPFEPSRWQWKKFKNLAHFYLFLGFIPLGVLTFLANTFVGPATLCEIPDNYEPYYWEYYRSPITRFIARYILNNPQQDYEKYLHFIYEADEKMKIRKLEDEIKRKMAERLDYQAYYFRPVIAKYHRLTKEIYDHNKSIRGD